MKEPTDFIKELCQHAIDAADPLKVFPDYWQAHNFEKGSYKVIGAGKASAAMAQALENIVGAQNVEGLVITRYGYSAPCEKIKVIEASHPVPDRFGMQATEEVLEFLEKCDEEDHVIALISGGGSSLLSKTAPCLSFEEKQSINKQLLHSGASIHEINTVRKHISAVKGGGLKKHIKAKKLTTFIISDVTGDVPHMIASGPTLADPTTQKEALNIIQNYNIDVSDSVKEWLLDPLNETDKNFEQEDVHIIATGKDSLNAAKDYALSQNVEVVDLGDEIEGLSENVAKEHLTQILKHQKSDKPVIFISGGETSVEVKAGGKGGRNTHYILSCLAQTKGLEGLYGAAIDTDGIDGSADNAGAYFTPITYQQAGSLKIDLDQALIETNSYDIFDRLDHLIVTKPTCTNVNDFRVLLKL